MEETYLLTMKNTLKMAIAGIMVLTVAACSQGADPSQVRIVKGDNNTVQERPVVPIKGRPYAEGAQWLYDQLVKGQTGGFIQSIKVYPDSVTVPYAWMYGDGNAYFTITGKARITLADNKGAFDAYFREVFKGNAENDRTLSRYSAWVVLHYTAYVMGLDKWNIAFNADNVAMKNSTTQNAVMDQLSIATLLDEMTSSGALDMTRLEDWKKANATAWTAIGTLPADAD